MKTIQAAAVRKLLDAQKLVTSAHQLDSSGQYASSQYEREVITNACFLNVFIALEEFFEESFGHYAMGRMSTARWRPSKYTRAPSEEHAQKMFIGFQHFMDWSTPSKVVQLAELYFAEGEPFAVPVKSALTHLESMKTVRNATAHISVTTQASLDAVHGRWTGSPLVGVSSYSMLLAVSSATGKTFYAESEAIVRSVVSQISSYA